MSTNIKFWMTLGTTEKNIVMQQTDYDFFQINSLVLFEPPRRLEVSRTLQNFDQNVVNKILYTINLNLMLGIIEYVK